MECEHGEEVKNCDESENISPDELSCPHCTRTFTRRSSLTQHVNKDHESSADTTKSNVGLHKCPRCSSMFTRKSAVKRHITRFHGSDETLLNLLQSGNCCLQCDQRFNQLKYFKQHLETAHGMQFDEQVLHFNNNTDFSIWKEQMEKDTDSRYVKQSGAVNSQVGNVLHYMCHRSGKYKSKAAPGERKRKMKATGSIKINTFCTSTLKRKDASSGEVIITYCPTHYGHNDMKDFRASASQRSRRETKDFLEVKNEIPEREEKQEDDFLISLRANVVSTLQELTGDVEMCNSVVSLQSFANILNQVKSCCGFLKKKQNKKNSQKADIFPSEDNHHVDLCNYSAENRRSVDMLSNHYEDIIEEPVEVIIDNKMYDELIAQNPDDMIQEVNHLLSNLQES